jgi:hypothetical protein
VATFGEIKARLADDFNRSDLTSQISDEIIRAIKHYERTRFWFNEAVSGSVLVASQQSYAMSSLSVSDLLILDRLQVTVSSHKYELNEIAWPEFLERWSDTTSSSGSPTDYSIYADKIWIGVTPGDAYSTDISYIKSLTTLSADGDSNAWTTYAEDLIASRAGKIVSMRVIKSAEDAAMYAVLEREALNALYAQNDQRLITGKMRYNG